MESLDGVSGPAGSDAAGHRSGDALRFDPPLVVRRFVVERELALAELLEEADARLAGSPASAERALWHGGLHVNGHPLDGDAPPRSVDAGSWVAVYAFEREPEPVPFESARVLYDGDGVVAVDKPPWLPMQRTRATARLSLEAALREVFRDDSLVAVHRLDRRPGGVALFARGREGAWASRALAERRVTKRYLAVTEPAPERDAFEVAGFLGRARIRRASASRSPPSRAPVRGGARRRVVSRRRRRAALRRGASETGRTHRLRVHLAAAGAPIAGDALYGAVARRTACSSTLRRSRSSVPAARACVSSAMPADVRDGLASSAGRIR